MTIARYQLLVVIAVTSALPSCNRSPAQTRRTAHGVGHVLAAASNASVLREFTILPLPTASQLLQEAETPAVRSYMASLYEDAGFYTIAALLDDRRAQRRVTWLCGAGPDRATLQAVADQRDAGDIQGALATAQALRASAPASCEAAVEWAATVLMIATADPGLVGAAMEEEAIRILVTSAAEVRLNPIGSTGSGPTIYYGVAPYLARRGYSATRRRALMLARDLLEIDDSHTDSLALRDSYRRVKEKIDAELLD